MKRNGGHRRPPGFFGNYRPEDVPLLEPAAAETGFEIEIRDDAVDFEGHPVAGCVAAYVTEDVLRDRSPLGRRFRELKKRAKGQKNEVDS